MEAVQQASEPHPTRGQANYRLPVQCCANCKGSYWNSYGFPQCKFLSPGTEVDCGGVCDLWQEDV